MHMDKANSKPSGLNMELHIFLLGHFKAGSFGTICSQRQFCHRLHHHQSWWTKQSRWSWQSRKQMDAFMGLTSVFLSKVYWSSMPPRNLSWPWFFFSKNLYLTSSWVIQPVFTTLGSLVQWVISILGNIQIQGWSMMDNHIWYFSFWLKHIILQE